MPSNQFGFSFWLAWIFWFAVSFILAALFWTGLLTWTFGSVQEPEIVLTWAVSVFGSWFLLITPFMRKKERIWKRLNNDQEKAVDAALLGMGIFVGLLIAACFFWSWKFKASILNDGKFNSVWAKAVIGSWLVLLLPFLIVMYRKADKIFKEAVTRQTQATLPFKTGFVEKSKRILPESISEKIKKFPETMERAHVLSLTLKDGRHIPHVFVLNGKEILGIYDREELGFEASDVCDAGLMETIPAYDESKWLRLDGRA